MSSKPVRSYSFSLSDAWKKMWGGKAEDDLLPKKSVSEAAKKDFGTSSVSEMGDDTSRASVSVSTVADPRDSLIEENKDEYKDLLKFQDPKRKQKK
ncbi:MAG TPA: hypothetical protein VLF61_00220 [Rhabdochlamydiaceae bacterium]|nr:hypothetical protein [Rhabdochlamydiaceae bacterium]